jgi:class 3 adenylate cyclase/predicted ATPase/DNA polymerase III delta prime subunit
MAKRSAPLGDVAAGRAERRNLTILFADIVGSSALATRLDPEDLREIIRAVQAALRTAIGRYDGHVARYLGDGMLAYFGFPTAHEDDAERAANAAFEMIESVSALSFPDASPLQLHIGIATGIVLVGDLVGDGANRQFELLGDAVNLAAWLQQHAEPNQILVAPVTRRLIGGLFEVADLGERAVKGHDRPVRVWRVLRPSTVRSRFDARRLPQLTWFFGRDRELATLTDEFRRVQRGEERLVLLSGEPGIGKSRLIVALCERLAGEPLRTFLFQCSSYYTSSPWHPIIRHLEEAAGVARESPASLKLHRLEVFVGRCLHERRQEIVPLLAALLSIPLLDRYPAVELMPQQRKRRTLSALLDLFRAQAEHQPAIFIFEDVHWIDPSSSELLALIRKELKDVRRLLVVSCRPEFEPTWRQDADVTSIPLGPLEPTEAARMVESLTETHALPATLVRQIVCKADGVPLFVEEVTKALLLGLPPGQAPRDAAADPVLAVPDTLQDTLMAKLDALGPMKAFAQVASAIGREFSGDLLEAVLPPSTKRVRAALDRLAAAGVLSREAAGRTERYAFRHALVQEAAYASILRADRRKLHLRIANALCGRFADVAASAPELVAHHYTLAGDARLATAYWLKAGRQASNRSAFVEATVHFRSALALLARMPETDERDELELQLQQSLASALIAARGFGAPDIVEALDRALQLCDRHPGTPHLFTVQNGLVSVHYVRGNFDKSLAIGQDMLAQAARRNDATALLIGHRILGMSLFATGELGRARAHLQNALDLYDPPAHAPLALVFSHDLRATAEVYLALTLVLLGDAEAGLRHGSDALAYAEELRHPHSICYVSTFLAGVHTVAGMPEAAVADAERTVAVAAEYGFPQWEAGGVLLRGWARLELGDLENSLADLRGSIAGMEASGSLTWLRFAHFLLAEALAKAGSRDASAELLDDVLAEIAANGGRWYEAEVHRLRGDLLLASGSPPADIEAAYAAARAVAVRQRAKAWERRADDALASLRPQSGQNGTTIRRGKAGAVGAAPRGPS